MTREYRTAAAFKQALEQRLRTGSISGIDFARRRQLVVFDRFLARIAVEFGDAVTLKGGLAVELRIERARTTKDAWRGLRPPRPVLRPRRGRRRGTRRRGSRGGIRVHPERGGSPGMPTDATEFIFDTFPRIEDSVFIVRVMPGPCRDQALPSRVIRRGESIRQSRQQGPTSRSRMMRSTRKGTSGFLPYLGVDLTDRYAAGRRPADVCGLDDDLNASFWLWEWGPASAPIDVRSVLPEVKNSSATLLDGPQGLARPRNSRRECERLSRAPGSTPWRCPPRARPFAGYIESSLAVFAALHNAGVGISPVAFQGGASEIYPGHVWMLLANRPLPKKSCSAGREVRRRILSALGVQGLPNLPNDDQNDACVAAVLAAAAYGKVPGLGVTDLGAALYLDQGVLREGYMAIPRIDPKLRRRLDSMLDDWERDTDRRPSAAQAPTPAAEMSTPAARQILAELARSARHDPQVVSYAWAYRNILGLTYEKWSQAYGQQVIRVARATEPTEVPGLGLARLDAFIVAKKTRFPADGHWKDAGYDREDWERALGTARLIH